jgi:tetratricopeptide (TPR) repeat protein
LGNIQGAIDDYTQALLINPADTELYYKRGLAHSCLGNKQAAIDDFKKAASIYLQENNFHDYYKTLGQLKNIQYDDYDYYYNYADFYDDYYQIEYDNTPYVRYI